MKTYFTLMLCFAFGLTQAQFTLIADYPFTSDGVDLISGDEAYMNNATFTEGGVYSNGIYAGDDPENATAIVTAGIDNFNFSMFKFTLEFRIDSLPELSWMPIIVGGSAWRWATVTVQDDGLLAFRANSGSDQQVSSQQVELGVWHDLEVEYNGLGFIVQLNESEAINLAVEELVDGENSLFSCADGSLGRNLKGYWRNLKIYNPVTVGSDDLVENTNVIYPNPAAENIQLSGWGNEHKTNIVDLLNTEGKVLHSFTLQNEPAAIDISGLAPGVYILRSVDHPELTKRLVVR